MSWIDKILPAGVRPAGRAAAERRSSMPEGVWKKCAKCEAVLYGPELEKCFEVCPKCEHHMRLGARARLDVFLDPDGREELATEVEPVDRLKFKDLKKYKDRLSAAQKSTGERDALLVMQGQLKGMPLVAAAFEFSFHGGSMGYAVGEKFTRGAQRALEQKIPLVCFSATGGARMQEALISLMQMAKTSAILERLKQAGVPYISVMTDPVYGGVSASLALLGDINIAEPNARAGFAGPNIIEQTIRQKLPPGFQRSEFLLDKGAIDLIVHRRDMRATLARLLASLTHQQAPGPDVVIAELAEPGAVENAESIESSAESERRVADADRRVDAGSEAGDAETPADNAPATDD